MPQAGESATRIDTALFGTLTIPTSPRPPRRRRAANLTTTRSATAVSSVRIDQLPDHPRSIETKDPYHEFRNDWEHPALARQLARLPDDYQYSVAWLRANRPTMSNGDALRFWLAPLSRAHMLNALLTRADRTLAQVQDDVQIPRDKLYQYLQRWGVTYEIRRRRVTVEDPDRRRAPGEVKRWQPTRGTALVRVDGYTTEIETRFDRISRTYRTSIPLPLLSDPLLNLTAASLLLGLTEPTIRHAIPAQHRSNQGVNLYHPDTLARHVPRATWRMTPDDARQAANPCQCVYWDSHLKACGLGNTTPADPTTCKDYAPLDHPTPIHQQRARPTIHRTLTTLTRHYDELRARREAPNLWSEPTRNLQRLGVTAGEPPPPYLTTALTHLDGLHRTLHLGADQRHDVPRIARLAPTLIQARGGRADEPHPLLQHHHLLRGDTLTLKGAAILNQLHDLALHLDTYLA